MSDKRTVYVLIALYEDEADASRASDKAAEDAYWLDMIDLEESGEGKESVVVFQDPNHILVEVSPFEALDDLDREEDNDPPTGD